METDRYHLRLFIIKHLDGVPTVLCHHELWYEERSAVLIKLNN